MNIPPGVTSLLQSTAPTLLAALALPPPANALAAGVVSVALERFAPGAKAAPLKPEQVAKVIEDHGSDPAMLPALRQAEADLKKFEAENQLKFAELDARDRADARAFQTTSGMSERVFRGGMLIVWVALFGMLAMIGGLLLLATGQIAIANSDITTAAFGLIGTAVGFVNGIAASVVAFYWGSSLGSKDKGDAMAHALTRLETAAINAAPPAPPPPAPPPTPPAVEVEAGAGAEAGAEAGAPPAAPPPARPVTPETIAQEIAKLARPHRLFPGSVEWALTAAGVAVDGAQAMGTTGDPETVTKIWKNFGASCAAAARRFGVPVELIVATIATESKGDPGAFRQERRDASTGLMQTLLETAREALGDKSLTAAQLREPETSIMAGTAYIRQQRHMTHFDPPLVAAAYNSGHPRQASHKSRWNLFCTQREDGDHVDHFVAYFNDAMAVSRTANWGAGDTPSFVTAIAEAAVRAFGPGVGGAGVLAAPLDAARASDAAAAVLRQVATAAPVEAIGGDKALAKAVQQKLSEQGYLDPPPDGSFQTISQWAFGEFRRRNGLPAEVFDAAAAQALLQPPAPLPAPKATGGWIDKVLGHMSRSGLWLARYPGCVNIVYLEGVDEGGRLNDNAPDRYNDLRLAIWLDDQGGVSFREWQATTEPGDYYTRVKLLNEKGAARIKFGQYKAWSVGVHRNNHQALVQTGTISVHRDFNKDFRREGDAVDTGDSFGVNQHWGYDVDPRSIKDTSAGCLVGRTTEGHKEFMKIVMSDPRYRQSERYQFVTTILPGAEVLRS